MTRFHKGSARADNLRARRCDKGRRRNRFNLGAQIADGLPALFRILLQASPQKLGHPRIQIWRQHVQVGLAYQDRREHVGSGVPLEWLAARHHLVQHAAERKDVAPLIGREALCLLRRHVGRGPEDDTRLRGHHAQRRRVGQFRRCGRGFHRLGQPEVEHLHGAVRPHFDVRGLEIAMNDALLVRRFERLGDLPGDLQPLVDRDWPSRNPLRQVLAFDEFHHQRTGTVGFFETVDVRNVGMIQCREGLRFAREPCQAFRIVRERVRQDFDCDVAIQPGVARAKHFAHPANPKG